MMSSLNMISRKALGLVVVVAMVCGLTVQAEKVVDHEHGPSDICHFETDHSHAHDHDDQESCSHENHDDPCDDRHGEDCPDTPHHHHKGTGCCQAVSLHAARTSPSIALRVPAAGRALVEWKNQHCDLDAVSELDLPPII